MRAAKPSVLRVLDGIRLSDTSASKGFGPWDPAGNGRYSSWAGYLLDIENEAPVTHRAGWRDNLERSEIATLAFQAGLQNLKALAGRVPDLRHLVHSDLLNRNAFVSDGRVTALIDWHCAMYGDFLYDLAWLTFWASWHPGVKAADFVRAPPTATPTSVSSCPISMHGCGAMSSTSVCGTSFTTPGATMQRIWRGRHDAPWR